MRCILIILLAFGILGCKTIQEGKSSSENHALEFSYKFTNRNTISLSVPDEMLWKPRFWKYDPERGFKLKLYYPSLKAQIKRISPYIGHKNSKAPQDIKDEYARLEKLHKSMGDELYINVSPYNKRINRKELSVCKIDSRFNLAGNFNGLQKYERSSRGSGSKYITLLPEGISDVDCITCVENANCRVYLYTQINGVEAEISYPETKTMKNWKEVVASVNTLLNRYLINSENHSNTSVVDAKTAQHD
ncbi:hypothetical protein ACUR5C_00340 [Aliikangiella sp. IMCC44653]